MSSHSTWVIISFLPLMERFKQFTWLCDSGTKLDELFYRSAGALRIQRREFQPPWSPAAMYFFNNWKINKSRKNCYCLVYISRQWPSMGGMGLERKISFSLRSKQPRSGRLVKLGCRKSWQTRGFPEERRRRELMWSSGLNKERCISATSEKRQHYISQAVHDLP